MSLSEEIRDRSVRACIMGIGYVGLPLALEFVRAGYRVIAFDTDPARVERLRSGSSYITDVTDSQVSEALSTGRFEPTDDPACLSDAQTINICVPTPLSKTGDPNLAYVQTALQTIRAHRRRGQLYILESTTYPGTTEEALLPALSEDGFQVGKDFFLAFSPERVDPGNPVHNTRNIPKVVGGVTEQCTELAAALYEGCIDTVVRVGSPRVAEMVKLLENTFRSVNIGLVNEVARMCHELKIDIWEAIGAAKTKPFGFMPFYPGPGLGGHCIPVDPIYLSWKARQVGFRARFIELAARVNASMPEFVVDLVTKALNEMKMPLKGARILLLGITYKADVNDVRESPALDVWHLLRQGGAEVGYHDPYVPVFEFEGSRYESSPLTVDTFQRVDCSVLLAKHKCLDLPLIYEHSRKIIDTRNAFAAFSADDHIIKL